MTMILTMTMVTMLIDRHTLNFQNRQKFEQVVIDGEHRTSSYVEDKEQESATRIIVPRPVKRYEPEFLQRFSNQ